MVRYKENINSRQTLNTKESGFTLIEIIIGIVMLSISLAIVSSLIAPTEEQSADNLLQIKAAELGQSLLNDISSRAFDHHSDMSGGRNRCDEIGQAACTANIRLGPEDGLDGRLPSGENSRDKYNDVDDFHKYDAKNDALDNSLGETYSSFDIYVDVRYAGADLGLADNLAKRITVTITTPLGTEIKFATHKANF
jgi:MSHA pilin protein MshD